MNSPSEHPLRVADLIARIREGVRREEEASRRQRPLKVHGGMRGFPTLRHAEELQKLNRGWMFDTYFEFRSHRRWIGRYIVATKRWIQDVVMDMLKGYFAEEREFLVSLVRYQNQTMEQLEKLAVTAHADDELLVGRTEIFLRRMMEEQRNLEREVYCLREEVSRLRAELGTRGSGARPAELPVSEGPVGDHRFLRCSEGDDRQRFAMYVPALGDFAPIFHVPAAAGDLIAILRESNLTASGLDPEPEMAELARGRGLDVRSGELTLASVESGAFGAVVLTEIEAFPIGALERMLHEAFSAVRPGGIVLVEALNPKSHEGLARLISRSRMERGRAFTPEVLRRMVESAGFVDVHGDLAAAVPPPLDLPTQELYSPVLRAYAENFRRLNDLLFPPIHHIAIGRRPAD